MVNSTHVSDIICISPTLLLSIMGMSAWGGVVKFIVFKSKGHMSHAILGQLVVSCFTGMLLSMFLLSRNASDNRLLIVAGLGGLFSGPLITLVSAKISAIVENMSATLPSVNERKFESADK